MAEWTQKQLEEMAGSVIALFDDGFQFSDLFEVVPAVMKVVGAIKGMTGPEKKATAIMLGEYVIDKTDFPWLPDAAVDPICKTFLPGAVQMAWDCYDGKHEFAPTPEGDAT